MLIIDKTVKQATIEELEAALEHKKMMRAIAEKPHVVDEPNLEELIAICQEYIDFVGSEDYHEDTGGDYEAYIFEAALTALYGDKVFNWINREIT